MYRFFYIVTAIYHSGNVPMRQTPEVKFIHVDAVTNKFYKSYTH